LQPNPDPVATLDICAIRHRILDGTCDADKEIECHALPSITGHHSSTEFSASSTGVRIARLPRSCTAGKTFAQGARFCCVPMTMQAFFAWPRQGSRGAVRTRPIELACQTMLNPVRAGRFALSLHRL
jgi:hypothetical protein